MAKIEYKYIALRPMRDSHAVSGAPVNYGRGDVIPKDAMTEKTLQRLSAPRVGFLQKVAVVAKDEDVNKIGDDLKANVKAKYAKAKEPVKEKPVEGKVEIMAKGIEPKAKDEKKPLVFKKKAKKKKKGK